MAESVIVLKKKAVKKGMDKKAAMKASRAELEEFLSGGGEKTPAKKKTTTAKKKTAAKKTAKKSPAKKDSTKKKTTAKKNSKPKKSSDGGRNMLADIDYTDTDGWNPREGSAVSVIFRALKKAKGNVDKATDALLPNAKEYVSLRKKDGTKRTKDEIRDLLRYRVNRTNWEFARRTGQHNPSENRIEYGTGDYAQRNSKKTTAKKTSAKKSTKKKTKTKKK